MCKANALKLTISQKVNVYFGMEESILIFSSTIKEQESWLKTSVINVNTCFNYKLLPRMEPASDPQLRVFVC